MIPAMDPDWKTIIWYQFGAAIDSMERAIDACPEALWGDRSRFPEFWYLVYHTLFFLDFYTSDSVEGFAPPEPFTLSELDPSGVLPDRVYSKDELRRYLEHGREKTRAKINRLTAESAMARRRFGSVEGSEAELLLYSMRHVQHHTAQLNLILRQVTDSAPGWVGRTKRSLSRVGAELERSAGGA
jgi:DinB superfamily